MNRPISSVLVSIAVLAAGGVAGAQSIFVTTRADTVDFTGAQTVAQLPGPDGLVSMREACLAANATAGPQTIGFHVPVSDWGASTKGPVILNFGASFPVSDDETTVDGTTQTAFTGDTNPDGAEVYFHSLVTDPPLVLSGTLAVSSDRNVFVGLGNMTGRNFGIDLLATADENTVRGCSINAVFAAVRVQGDRNTIGDSSPGAGNTLSSLADGLRIQGLDGDVAEDNVVIGNSLTGGFNGVQITGNATGNVIGGTRPGEANHIARAGYLQEDGTPDGAMVRIESDGNTVGGNLIGTDATGTAAADNPGDVGIEIYGDDNYVVDNVIGGITGMAGLLSVQAGIHLREGAERNTIERNRIGVDLSGTIPIPNHVGILISAFDSSLPMPRDNAIGGPAAGNVIAHNDAGGIRVLLDSTGNRIQYNELRDNHASRWLGIDLGGDGLTPNDTGDVDTGPNLLMNRPMLNTAVIGDGITVVTGRIDVAAPADTVVEIYSNAPPAPGEVLEAETHLAFTSVKPDGRFWAAITVGNTLGLSLTAIATDAAGNSSEISAPISVGVSPWEDLGFALPGSYGDPVLFGGGPLVPDEEVALLLGAALENSTGFWVIGTTTVFAPAVGGTLVPAPQVIVPLVTDGATQGGLVGRWPAVPAGTTVVAQAFILDASATQGVAASNAVKGTAP